LAHGLGNARCSVALSGLCFHLPDGRTIPVTLTGADIRQWSEGRHQAASSTNIIDASVNVQIDGTGKTTDEIKSELMPMFAQQQRVIIERVQAMNEDDPNFLT
jgi:hypothetical protein